MGLMVWSRWKWVWWFEAGENGGSSFCRRLNLEQSLDDLNWPTTQGRGEQLLPTFEFITGFGWPKLHVSEYDDVRVGQSQDNHHTVNFKILRILLLLLTEWVIRSWSSDSSPAQWWISYDIDISNERKSASIARATTDFTLSFICLSLKIYFSDLGLSIDSEKIGYPSVIHPRE